MNTNMRIEHREALLSHKGVFFLFRISEILVSIN